MRREQEKKERHSNLQRLLDGRSYSERSNRVLHMRSLPPTHQSSATKLPLATPLRNLRSLINSGRMLLVLSEQHLEVLVSEI
jgi:hypothetical protein